MGCSHCFVCANQNRECHKYGGHPNTLQDTGGGEGVPKVCETSLRTLVEEGDKAQASFCEVAICLVPYPRDNLEDEMVSAPFDRVKQQVLEFRRLW